MEEAACHCDAGEFGSFRDAFSLTDVNLGCECSMVRQIFRPSFAPNAY
jgi:hypothetical protein